MPGPQPCAATHKRAIAVTLRARHASPLQGFKKSRQEQFCDCGAANGSGHRGGRPLHLRRGGFATTDI